jgi:hypothetical protein
LALPVFHWSAGRNIILKDSIIYQLYGYEQDIAKNRGDNNGRVCEDSKNEKCYNFSWYSHTQSNHVQDKKSGYEVVEETSKT